MNNYEEQTSEREYTMSFYLHEGGITPIDIPHQRDNQPSCIEDSKLIAVIQE